jgi:succinyl-CoA synthetase beta subunit
MTREQAAGVAAQVGLAELKDETADRLLKLYDLFMKKDALLIEVNPYAEDASGKCKNKIIIRPTIFCVL